MITEQQHIKKHTKKENTYDKDCPFCNPEKISKTTSDSVLKEIKEVLKCDECGKLAKYIFSTYIQNTLWDLKGNRINNFDEDQTDKQYCKHCAENAGIL